MSISADSSVRSEQLTPTNSRNMGDSLTVDRSDYDHLHEFSWKS